MSNGLESSKKRFAIIASLGVLLLILLLPTPDGLSSAGHRTIGVFAMVIILWGTNAIPLSVTGILVFAALPLLGVADERVIYSFFGNSAIFFILGAFILAAAMMKTGLSMRLSLILLKAFGTSPSMLIAGVMMSSAVMALIMPAHAVAAIMFPIVLDIARSLELEPLKTRYGGLLFLSLAWGSVIGGIATLLGGARNPLAIALLEEYHGMQIGFFEWIRFAGPISFVILIIAYVIATLAFGIDIDDVSKAKSIINKDLINKEGVTSSEKKVALILILTFFSWMFLSSRLGIANIALLASVLLFVLGVIDWKDVEDYVNWGVILMYGGAIALGSALVSTGAVQWLADTFLPGDSMSPLVFLMIFSFISLFLTEVVSNVATVAIVLPLGFSVGSTLGINPLATMFIVALPSGLAFTLPIATPPNAIAYSSGYYEIKDVIRAGLILNILAWIVFILMAILYWPTLGVNLVTG